MSELALLRPRDPYAFGARLCLCREHFSKQCVREFVCPFLLQQRLMQIILSLLQRSSLCLRLHQRRRLNRKLIPKFALQLLRSLLRLP